MALKKMAESYECFRGQKKYPRLLLSEAIEITLAGKRRTEGL